MLPSTTCPTPADISVWNDEFQDADAEEVLRWAAARWGRWLVLTCSFGGPAGMVLLDMLMRVAPTTDVIYIDTGLLFPETYRLIEQVRQRYCITPRAVHPRLTLEQQAAQHGPELWRRDPDSCCRLRKVQPLAEALAPYDAWITGLRRSDAATRAQAQRFQWSAKYSLVKINPLVTWSDRDVWRYIHAHQVPYNPLMDQGYRSLGCRPCTRPPINDDPRSGRWVGFAKTECGIHVE
ncbi:phosphoadenylyl-sulfate reductase [Kallotenue papyrolyticum]|uniref:phosphoadenylyl-sulfate reductase n=1 Tax=Kallotenue papyrolyticum TaxID=1325125 RepID=UPI00049284FD|nr:phosphoadenylyl-sulfate reductase [Kallotenue papyrolyticum]